MSTKTDKKYKNYLTYVAGIAREYYEHKHTLDSLQSEMNNIKSRLSNTMAECFDTLSDDGKHVYIPLDSLDGTECVSITRVIVTKVAWDINKLKNMLPKKYRKSVIKKKYQVADWNGLFEFLKDSGIEFKELKRFLTYEEYVVESSIDRLIDLGFIEADEVKKCSIVDKMEPQYRVTVKKS